MAGGTEVYGERLERARAAMQDQGLDYMLVGPSADLLYLIGSHQKSSERLALLVVPREGPACMVLPAFEARSLPPLPPAMQVVTWGESDNPARILASMLANGSHSHPGGLECTIGVSDRVWSVFLLQLEAELPRAAFTRAAGVLSALRQVKTPEETTLLRHSGAMADEVFAEISTRRFSGRSEKEIGREIAAMLKERGLEIEGLPIVASGPNSASPHHHTGERAMQPGDVVVLDFGGTADGYYSDITRTVFVGTAPAPDSEEAKVYGLVKEAQEAAVQAARPGMSGEGLDAVARDILDRSGYGEHFIHRLGHGIGLDGHEPPYLVKGNAALLGARMAFSIEPGLYLPGKFGVRIEDVVVLGEGGAERMNNVTREVVVVA